MPYFQNVFDSEFVGSLLLGDRQLSLNFRIKGNVNSSIDMIAWNQEPYNLSTNKTLTFNYSFDSGSTYTSHGIDVSTSAASAAAAKAFEVVTALNNDSTFSALFTASVITDAKGGNYVKIHALRSRERWRMYFSNSSAESVLRFNKKAGVAELPSYFERHTIGSGFSDSTNMLIQLSNPVAGVDVAIVSDAGLDPTTVRADYQLLDGRSGLFTFRKQTVDGSNRVTQIIEFPAGAEAGDLAKKITMSYTTTNTNPDRYAEVPYVLQSADLFSPP